MYDKLNNSEVSEGAVQQLLILARGIFMFSTIAVESKDWQSAFGAHQNLSNNFQAEGSKWIIGIKRLLGIDFVYDRYCKNIALKRFK